MSIRHIVLFTALPSAEPQEVTDLIERLSNLSALPQVQNCTAGRNFSGRSEFTIGFTCDFDNQEDLDAYITHPTHQALVEHLPSVVETGWTVVDYHYLRGTTHVE